MAVTEKLRVVSVSLGSARRDYTCTVRLLGREVELSRRGVNGDVKAACRLVAGYDGRVAAIGLGGLDLYIHAAGRCYVFRQAEKIARCARCTPVVDGSGLKDSLERLVVRNLLADGHLNGNERVLLVCGVDRFGMAEEMVRAGCRMVFGDLMFALGIPWPIRTLAGLARVARVLAPLVTKLPIAWLYPTGRRQEDIRPRFAGMFAQADVIAGDWHFIRRNLPDELPGKTVITNTITEEDIGILRRRRVARLVTTTPCLGRRAFGTNLIEAMLVALGGNYQQLLGDLGMKPTVIDLTGPAQPENLFKEQGFDQVCVHSSPADHG
ncbi:MAG: quinate 5-dehydrogenase [Negativicutes bacterium]|nr:quinate 5-dehydrogenase [Negativicutes bacterium]